jgi:MtN3 and saliva related transmembrane protein
MDLTEAVGMAAGVLTTLAYLPQVIKAWRTRSTGDVSLIMFLALVTGIALWALYGFLKGDLPVILANVSALCLTSTVLYLKLRYG